MPRTRRPYPPEFREHILSLARQGRSAWDLAEEFEPCHATIRSWMLKAGIVTEFNETNGSEDDPSGELARLRREVAVLREEKEILAKAAAWFAEETGRTPRGRSSS